MSINNTFRDVLKSGARVYGLSLDDNCLSRFETYMDILSSWNRYTNLVSARDMNRFVEYHLLDSLKVAPFVNFSNIATVMDYGSGAGLPGIPLALAFPSVKVTLVDSRSRRCLFLEEVLTKIPTLHAVVIRSRVEDLPVTCNNSFTLVITRGTAKLPEFFNVSSRFIPSGGMLVAIKGDAIESELQDLYETVDSRFFNISTHVPEPFNNVRRGKVVIITHV